MDTAQQLSELHKYFLTCQTQHGTLTAIMRVRHKRFYESIAKYVTDKLDSTSIGILYDLVINNMPHDDITDNNVLYYYAQYFMLKDDNANMLKYLTKSADSGNIKATHHLVVYYRDKDESMMLKYVQIAIDLKSTISMRSVGAYYRKTHNDVEMVRYFKMAAELNDRHSIAQLLKYYCGQHNHAEIIKYYPLAFTHKLDFTRLIYHDYTENNRHSDALKIFTELYKLNINPEKMIYFISKLFAEADFIKLFMSEYIELQDRFQNQDAAIKTYKEEITKRDGYIEELELLPEGRQYKAVKEHFDASVKSLDNQSHSVEIEQLSNDNDIVD
ncbi:MAG: hypothetical protein Faunusvirus6_23 [Faunusvirus sp.]|uniref:Uncharacterized protein n=1 Tax=Faunusvirus sp. TaxID=2487766 RepID=A0A3G4ZWI7_9VIRU|nr:MAG: hypothetical protein Faunusvirus6_23 [Faunusvirus sp.]